MKLPIINDMEKRRYRYILTEPDKRNDRWDVDGLLEAQRQADQKVVDELQRQYSQAIKELKAQIENIGGASEAGVSYYGGTNI